MARLSDYFVFKTRGQRISQMRYDMYTKAARMKMCTVP